MEGHGLARLEENAVFKAKDKEVTFKTVHPDRMQGFMSIGQGMGKTLVFAEEKQGYTITDRGTYVQYKYGRQEGLDLEPICEGDTKLFSVRRHSGQPQKASPCSFRPGRDLRRGWFERGRRHRWLQTA